MKESGVSWNELPLILQASFMSLLRSRTRPLGRAMERAGRGEKHQHQQSLIGVHHGQTRSDVRSTR